ncbi:NAD-dependent protein deacetylase [Nonlabens ulvanivorans]|nr:NAD-dependent protein deacetylase [Nonlabens ulvanivorans]
MLNFYNLRRSQLKEVEPNLAHHCIAGMERNFNVHVITQNVDDLHERAGSSNIIHLHGELRKVRSSKNYHDQQHWEDDLHLGDLCDAGSPLRPHIVWFGEEVPAMDQAIEITAKADVLLIVGTSLQVYPAAGLKDYAPPQDCPIYFVDPNPSLSSNGRLQVIAENASTGVQKVADLLNMEL